MTFMTSTVDVLNVSTDAPAAAVAIPDGFKESR
jgi:hypothetical protein